MRVRYAVAAVVIALVSSFATWTWATAQVMGYTPVPHKVMSSGDLGFRVEGLRGETPVGRFVVRVNDRWVPVDVETLGPRQLSQR